MSQRSGDVSLCRINLKLLFKAQCNYTFFAPRPLFSSINYFFFHRTHLSALGLFASDDNLEKKCVSTSLIMFAFLRSAFGLVWIASLPNLWNITNSWIRRLQNLRWSNPRFFVFKLLLKNEDVVNTYVNEKVC